MAIYFLNVKSIGRSGGSSSVSAAAYRAGERIRDERTGKIYDHTNRSDVLHKEILLPDGLAPDRLEWTSDRSHLWNAAERAELRGNARVAREFLVNLPYELDALQRTSLAQTFARELVERYRFALDLVVHAPRDFEGSDPRNFHAHMLATTREAGEAGLGGKISLEWGGTQRAQAGLGPSREELFYVRRRWAEVANEALASANVSARIDHRSLAERGIDREPYPRLSRAAWEIERRGFSSHEADRVRQEYADKVQARQNDRHSSTESLEDVRRHAREAWLKLRQGGAATSDSKEQQIPTRDDDFAP